ncbi:uncharacterized protein BDW47DRAFT_129233 [Aspergillus candidus]|uniref:Uncharacterized protein n=1 Tax=Aspergillus candidus TaxID=41067 RepID=A0A2I2F0S5_ASPCN|nr:hypothetical protein BDW47DRAFT_129233 [Aspergillus candidus]PLB34233.1 hypothetical protein BDW47DRAFT_129233 [Aspergillus candidus]
MKFTAVLALCALAPMALAQGSLMDKRGCKPSNCACIGRQGQFCGDESINKACTNGHVFECNGNSGKSCDYGVRDSCRKCGKLSC